MIQQVMLVVLPFPLPGGLFTSLQIPRAVTTISLAVILGIFVRHQSSGRSHLPGNGTEVQSLRSAIRGAIGVSLIVHCRGL